MSQRGIFWSSVFLEPISSNLNFCTERNFKWTLTLSPCRNKTNSWVTVQNSQRLNEKNMPLRAIPQKHPTVTSQGPWSSVFGFLWLRALCLASNTKQNFKNCFLLHLRIILIESAQGEMVVWREGTKKGVSKGQRDLFQLYSKPSSSSPVSPLPPNSSRGEARRRFASRR